MKTYLMIWFTAFIICATFIVTQVGGYDVTALQTQIVTLSQNSSEQSNIQIWKYQEEDITLLFNLVYAKLAPYWSGNLTALSSAVNASKAEAIAKNIMYAKQADLDIQNLFANLYNATQDAATCCGWSYNTTY